MTAEGIATGLVCAGGIYAALGAVAAGFLLARGLRRLDPAAAQAGIGFKLLILPGMIALWPLLLRRLAAGRPPAERNAHDRAAGGRR